MRLLDVCCKAGGCSMGYSQAGFDEIVGVDIVPQKRYPFKFVLADGLAFLAEYGHLFDFIHVSPPCQGYGNTWKIKKNKHPMLIEPFREILLRLGKPYVIENVPGAPLINPVELDGTMFGLMTVRRRLFECSFLVEAPPKSHLPVKQAKMGRKPKDGEYMQVVGNFSCVPCAKQAMGIDWMVRDELREAIPPAYTRWLGQQYLKECVTI